MRSTPEIAMPIFWNQKKKNPRASVLGQEFDKTLQWALCVALAKSPSLSLMGTIVSQVFVRLKRGWKMIILSSTAVPLWEESRWLRKCCKRLHQR